MSDDVERHVRNGSWVKLGQVGIDSASIGITDLLPGDWGTGIRFCAGFGDSGCAIWGWIVDYGEDEVDERVAQVLITMINADDLTDWYAG